MSNHRQQIVPIRNDAINIFETEFASMRQNFDAAMRRMDEDMRLFFPTRPTRTQSDQPKPSGAAGMGQLSAVDGSGAPSFQLEDMMRSSIVQSDANNIKSLRLRFDVHDYAPEEVEVTTTDDKVMVHARHVGKKDGMSVVREFTREFSVPGGIDPEALQTTLSADGVLTVTGPLAVANHQGAIRN